MGGKKEIILLYTEFENMKEKIKKSLELKAIIGALVELELQKCRSVQKCRCKTLQDISLV